MQIFMEICWTASLFTWTYIQTDSQIYIRLAVGARIAAHKVGNLVPRQGIVASPGIGVLDDHAAGDGHVVVLERRLGVGHACTLDLDRDLDSVSVTPSLLT